MATLQELIRHETPISTGATAVYPYKPMLERRYKFVSRFGDEVKLHTVDKLLGIIHLPRALCPMGEVDNRADGEHIVFPKGPNPRDHQVELFDKTASFLLKGQSGVVSAYTGWGKTVLGYHAAYVTQRKTLVITTKEDIYDQWLAGAQQFLGLPAHEVGEIRGDKCEVVGTKFVVAMVQSLSKEGKYPDWITHDFGLVIFDECHRMNADQFSNVIDMFPAKLRLGLSATPERADGKEMLVYAHIGPIRAKTEAELMVPKVLRFNSGWQCPRRNMPHPDTGQMRYMRIPHMAGKTAHVEKFIMNDPVRNHLLAQLVDSAFKKDRKLVVFSTLHEHLHLIQRACQEAFSIPGKAFGMYVGTNTKAEKLEREKAKVKPIMLTTYMMMGEGTSIDWLDCALLAMPRSNVTQPVGRIRREYPDKGLPTVMDVMDHDSPVFSGYAASRLQWYNSIGAVVKDIDV